MNDELDKPRPIDFNNVIPLKHMENVTFEHRKLFKKQIIEKICRNESMTEEQVKAVENIISLTLSARWNLYRLWINLYVRNVKSQIKDLHVKCNAEKLESDKLYHLEDIAIVKKAKTENFQSRG